MVSDCKTRFVPQSELFIAGASIRKSKRQVSKDNTRILAASMFMWLSSCMFYVFLNEGGGRTLPFNHGHFAMKLPGTRSCVRRRLLFGTDWGSGL